MGTDRVASIKLPCQNDFWVWAGSLHSGWYVGDLECSELQRAGRPGCPRPGTGQLSGGEARSHTHTHTHTHSNKRKQSNVEKK